MKFVAVLSLSFVFILLGNLSESAEKAPAEPRKQPPKTSFTNDDLDAVHPPEARPTPRGSSATSATAAPDAVYTPPSAERTLAPDPYDPAVRRGGAGGTPAPS